MAESLAPCDIAAVYSSPYRRALETIEPLAHTRNLPVQIVDAFRERLLTTEAMTEEDRLRQTMLSAEDADYRPPGGESRREAAGRGLGAISDIGETHTSGLVAIGTHAGLIRIIFSTFDLRADIEFGLTMPMPAVYRLTRDGVAWKPDLRPVFPRGGQSRT